MRSFGSDNNSGVHPEVLKAIAEANDNHAPGYGDEAWTHRAEQEFKAVFGEQAEALIVFNGTGANAVALQILTRPYNSILCAETAHILMDECGAPCRMTGCQLRPIATPDGKLTPELIRPYLQGFGDQHHSQPKAIYLSQCTEMGTVYTPEELKAITALAHECGMFVHMDGARIANAAAYLDCSLKAITTDCGIDILSFGGTKNGLMMGESVVILNPALKGEAYFIRKQSAQLASKMRYLSCQFSAYFAGDLWLRNATHANGMAQRIYKALSAYQEIEFLDAVESNVMFLRMPAAWARELRKTYFFYFLSEERGEIRLVTSFDTTDEDVEGLIGCLAQIATQHTHIPTR